MSEGNRVQGGRSLPWLVIALGGGGLLAAGCVLAGLTGGTLAVLGTWRTSPSAAAMYQRAKADPAFAKSISGKRMKVSGRVAKTNMFPGVAACSVYLEHGDDPARFLQDRIMVVFVPRDNSASHFKGFDLVHVGNGVVRFPWADGDAITVTGLVRYDEGKDLLLVNDATLE